MDPEGKTMAEIAHEMLFIWAQRQGNYICQWCSRFVPVGHAYCDACYDMIMKHICAETGAAGMKTVKTGTAKGDIAGLRSPDGK